MEEEAPRYTFAIIHDDEFQPMKEEAFERAEIKTDTDDWRDTWKKQPEVFRNQIRAAPVHSTHQMNEPDV